MSLAFYIVVPIGALSILYIKRTLQKGAWSGIISSLGVTTAECFYAFAAIYGLSFISDFLLKWQFYLQLFGALLMILIGLKAIFSKSKISPIKIEKEPSKGDLFGDYFSMMLLTIFNPLTIFGFLAVFTSFANHRLEPNFLNRFSTLLGFFTMSFSYCMLLIFIATLLKEKFTASDSNISGDFDLIKMLNQISGVVIIIFTLLSLFMSLTNN
jgi:threonine/homoserine/homoserine lactone efflux protein